MNKSELYNFTKLELINKCKELNIKKYSNKNKDEIISMILLHNNNSFKFIDLFCGIGGFHQALKNINGECVFACDIDNNCRNIYEQNYGLKPEGDITKINIKNIPSFDILCAGFPCQPFSKAGYQKGFDDDRGNLFFNICNIIEYHKPKYLLLENVKNLSSHDDGNTWKVIKENIDKLGYYTYYEPVILNVLHFNIPQNRERVIIMCKRKDLGGLNELPIINKNPKDLLTTTIKEIIDSNNTELNNKYKIDGKMKKVEIIWDKFIKLLINNKISIPKYPIWTDWWDNDLNSDINFYKKYKNWIDKNRQFYNNNKNILEPWLKSSRECNYWKGAVRKFEWQAGDELIDDGMDKVLWTARGSGIRIKRLNYIPTLVAMSMIPIYGPESRKLTPLELLRLQSFPDNFKYDEKTIFKQIGNSVNVKMIEQCAKFLILNEKLF
jgi:DNA (cytosine-5)-methyltransferase 1